MAFCHVTSRIEDDKDQDLLAEKGGRGFPTLLFLDAEGEILAQQGDRSVDAFRATLGQIETLAALEAKAERTADEEVALFHALVDLGRLKLAAAQERAAKLPQPPTEQGKAIAQKLIDLEISERMDSVSSREEMEALVAHLAGMAQAGRTPTPVGIPAARFWMAVSQHADGEADAKLFAQAVAGVEKALGGEERYEKMIQQMRDRLAELEGGDAKSGGK